MAVSICNEYVYSYLEMLGQAHPAINWCFLVDFKGLQQLKLPGDLASQRLVTYSGNSDEISPPLNGWSNSSGCKKTSGLAISPLSSLILCSTHLAHIACSCLCSWYSRLPFSGMCPCLKILEKVNTDDNWSLHSHPKLQPLCNFHFIFFQVLLFHFSVW